MYIGSVSNFRGILKIHPSFRIVALSEPPVVGSSSQQWLTSELLTMFLYHDMRSLSQQEEMHVLHKLVSYYFYSDVNFLEYLNNFMTATSGNMIKGCCARGIAGLTVHLIIRLICCLMIT